MIRYQDFFQNSFLKLGDLGKVNSNGKLRAAVHISIGTRLICLHFNSKTLLFISRKCL